MTEAEWVACSDPGPMLEFLRGRATDRKLRLFAVACCRRFQPQLDPYRVTELQLAIELVERIAGKRATDEEWREAREALAGRTLSDQTIAILSALDPDIRAAAVGVAAAALAAVCHREELRGLERQAQTDLLRCIFGPLPFRPVTVHPHVLAWNDHLVVRLAQSIYDERRWGDMPILGDALLDAGCNDDEVMAHCRAGVGHVKGCWVADLCLGKSWERALADEHPPFGHYPPRPDAVRVVLSDGPLSGFEVGVMPPLPPVIRVNAPRHGDHRVWITHTYALRGQRYEYVKTDQNSVSAAHP